MEKHISRSVRDFNKAYCVNLMENIPFLNQEMSTMAKLQLMSRLKAPYQQTYSLKFGTNGLDMASLALMFKNNLAQANPAVNLAQRGLAGLRRPEEALQQQRKKQKVEEKEKEEKQEKEASRSTSKSSASESSETSETEETDQSKV